MPAPQKSQRINFNVIVVDPENGEHKLCTAVSLWEYGAKIESRDAYQPGSTFECLVRLPGQTEGTKCALTVLSCRPGVGELPNELMVEFEGMPESLEFLIRSAVTEKYALRLGLGAGEVVPPRGSIHKKPIKVFFKEMSAAAAQALLADEGQMSATEFLKTKFFPSTLRTLETWAPNMGFQLRSKRAFKPGACMALDFELPGIPLGLGMMAEVTMAENTDQSGFNLFSVRFTALSKDDALIIEKFISSHERREKEKAQAMPREEAGDLPAPDLPLPGLPVPRKAEDIFPDLPALPPLPTFKEDIKDLPRLPKFGGDD